MTVGSLFGMPPVPLTTIKVPRPLRERVSSEASRRGLTAAGLITDLLDEAERRERFAAVRCSYERVDAAYVEETAGWDALSGDGLEP